MIHADVGYVYTAAAALCNKKTGGGVPVHERIKVDGNYKYPAARVPINSRGGRWKIERRKSGVCGEVLNL